MLAGRQGASGYIVPSEFRSLHAGDRVEVTYDRADQESFKYVAKHVRRVEPPAGAASMRLRRVLTSVGGAFAGFTLCWVAWGKATPGDFFANGNPLLAPTLVGALLIGGALGAFAHGRKGAIVIALLAAAALLFWVLVPDGWWAHPLRPT